MKCCNCHREYFSHKDCPYCEWWKCNQKRVRSCVNCLYAYRFSQDFNACVIHNGRHRSSNSNCLSFKKRNN